MHKTKDYEVIIDRLRKYDGGPDFSKALFEGTFYVLYDGVCIGGRLESQPWDKDEFVDVVSGTIARHTYAQLGYQWSQLVYSTLKSALHECYPVTTYFETAPAKKTISCRLGTPTPEVTF